MTKKAARDRRNPRVPLDNPPFGDPPLARRCPNCDHWYPWYAFSKPIRRSNGSVRGMGHYEHCLVCREATGWTRPTRKQPEPRLPVTSPQDDFAREVIAMRKERTSK